ncbi:MAG: hypothetical protein ABL903_13515 [Methylococcales bacterium]
MRKTANKQKILLALWTVSSVPVTTWALTCDQTVSDDMCLNKVTHTPKSVDFINKGFITLKTATQQVITLDVEVQSAQAFEQTLSGISLGTDSSNTLTSPLRINSRQAGTYNILRPELSSEPATLANTPGLYLLPYLPQKMAQINAAYFIFKDANGQLKQRALPPIPADWDSLSSALKKLNFSNIALQPNGTITATANNGKILSAIADYKVIQGQSVANEATFDTGIGDVNSDGADDVSIIYPNGDRQTLVLQPFFGAAFVLKSAADAAGADAYLAATIESAVIEVDLSSNEYTGADITLNNFSSGDKIRFNLADGIVTPGAGAQHSATANQYFSNLNTANAQHSDAIIHAGDSSVITLMSSMLDIQHASTEVNSLHINLTGGIKNKNLFFEFF